MPVERIVRKSSLATGEWGLEADSQDMSAERKLQEETWMFYEASAFTKPEVKKLER